MSSTIFLRTCDRNEIDFIIELGNRVVAIEVKFASIVKK